MPESSDKTKILFIGSIPPPYHGVTIQNEKLLASKLMSLFEVIHLDTTDRRDLQNLGKLDLGNVILGIKHLLSLLSLLIKTKPNIVYLTVAQNTIAYLRDSLFIIISRLFSKGKVVIHFRGGNYLNFYKRSSFILKRWMNFTYNLSHFGIVLGKKLEPMISQWYDANHILIIPEGIDYNIDINDSATKDLTLGYIGAFAESKGTLSLIEIFNQLHKKHNHLKLLLAGEFAYTDVKYKQKIYDYIEKNDLAEHIIFLGRVSGEEKQDFFRETDIFIFPSHMEGLPIAILEALACGLPVVASDVGAVSEAVIDNENGCLVDAHNPDMFLNKIAILISDASLRGKMAEKSKEIYTKKFTFDRHVNKMIHAFKLVAES